MTTTIKEVNALLILENIMSKLNDPLNLNEGGNRK